ncbi:putative endoribonuclease L-PSP [Colletotrichum higginsianum]|nr:putative endoribonuclease L-PSP [Colletotrichum higginsianum]
MKRDYQGINEEWNKVFTTRAEAPARAMIGVKELPDPRMLVEITGVAIVEDVKEIAVNQYHGKNNLVRTT